MRPRIAIVGPGVVGCALGRVLRRKRWRIVAVAGRSIPSARKAAEFIGGGIRVLRNAAAAAHAADVVLLTTPDRAIGPVCAEIAAAGGIRPGSVVLHCSGALGPDVLAPARRCGAAVGALHPVQSFASSEQAVRRLRGTWWTFSVDPEAEKTAAALVSDLGGRRAAGVPKDRAAYHAALCVLSNYLVALTDAGELLLQCSGLEAGEAARVVRPLLRGTLENLEHLDAPAALTGPIARGDVAVVMEHLRALRRLPAPLDALYRAMGLYTVDVARRKGALRAPQVRALRRALHS